MNESVSDDLQQAVDVLPLMFFQKDTKNNIVRTNKAAADAVGTTVASLIGTPTTQWFPDEAGDYYKDDQKVMNSGVPRLGIVEKFQMSGDVKHWIRTDKYPHYDDSGNVDGLLVFVCDVTAELTAENERQALETQLRQAQKLEGIGVLAAGVAHDFNNYLMSIVGHAELSMMHVDDTATIKSHLDKILFSAQQASEVCRQLLAYAGKQESQLKPCYLSDILRDTKELLEIPISGNFELNVEAIESASAIQADPSQIKQILINLVTNAAEAMGERLGQIRITSGERYYDTGELACSLSGIKQSSQPGRYCFIKIEDQGVGMTHEILDQIFQPFFTTRTSGRGLGLVTVLGTVRSHQGVVKVTSEPAVGTTVELIFPTIHSQLNVEKTELEAARESASKSTLLVVDDDENVRFVLQGLLEQGGYSVIAATDGVEAIELFQKYADDIQAVLLDYSMPGRNGVEVFMEINQIKPGIPVLFSSGYPEEISIVQLEDKGNIDYIKKPYRSADLLERIRQLLPAAVG